MAVLVPVGAAVVAVEQVAEVVHMIDVDKE